MSYVIAILVALGLYYFLDKKVPLWVWMTLPAIPIIYIFLSWPTNARILSFEHGFLHGNIIYQIVNGQIPPSNPFLAHDPVKYMWGYHFIVALLTVLTFLSPFKIFAGLQLMSICFIFFFLYRISLLQSENKITAVLAGFAGLFAVTPLTQKVTGKTLAFFGVEKYSFGITTYFMDKFNNHNPMPVGAVFFCAALFLYFWFLYKQEITVKTGILFGISLFLSGFTYPLLYIALFPPILANAAVQYKDLKIRRSLLILAGICVVSTGLLYPYFHSLVGESVKSVTISLHSDFGLMVRRLMATIVVLLPLALISFWDWKRISPALEEKRSFFITLALFILASAGLYCTITSVAYKYLLMVKLLTGIYAGLVFGLLYEKDRRLFVPLFALFLAPSVLRIDYRLQQAKRWDRPLIYKEHGKYLEHDDPEENALMEWVRNNTRAKDVFLDSKITLPIFAGRQLFVAKPMGYAMGYPSVGLALRGHPKELVKKRRKLLNKFINELTPIDENLLRSVRREISDRSAEIYFISRNSIQQERAVESGRFESVYTNGPITVYKLLSKENQPVEYSEQM